VDADAELAAASRPLVIGIGGGGDVVGALAAAEPMRLHHRARPILGGVSWERLPIDPEPGPRRAGEVHDARPLAPGVLAAGPATGAREGAVRFAEARMAELLGDEVLLIDPTPGPAAISDSLAQAADALEADLLVFVDVGGDVLASGEEAGLGSPLCDAILLAAAARLAALGRRVVGAIFGPGCDGELTIPEVLGRVALVARAGGLAGARAITPAVAGALEGAVAAVPTEASAQALRAFHGATGAAPIRGGRRTVELSPVAALTVYFDVTVAIEAAAPLARAVDGAADLEEANDALNALGVRTELDWERERAPASGSP
jgi:hypothetical protein